MKLKVGGRLMFFGCFAMIISFLAMGVIVSIQTSRGITALVNNELDLVTGAMADYLEINLTDELQVVVGLATNGDIRDGLEAQGKSEFATETLAELSTHLAELRKSEQFVNSCDGLLIISKKGKVVAASDTAYQGSDVTDRDYFKNAMKGSPFISNMVTNKVTGENCVVFAAPVQDHAGVPIGVLSLFMKTSGLTHEMAKYKLGTGGYFFVADQDGLFVMHPDSDYVFKANIKDLPGLESVAGKALNGASGIQEYQFEGIDRITGFAPVPSIHWIVFSSMQQDEYLATATSVRFIIIIVAVLAVIFSIISLFIVSRPIVKSLKRIGKFAVNISTGDLTIEVGSDTLAMQDEFGDVARALNTMVHKLRSITTDIHSASGNVAQGSEQLSVTSQQMSQGATEQAASLEEVTSSVEEMSATIKQNADNAKTTETIARKSASSAENGGNAVIKTVEAMKAIAAKTGIIEEIARSTNMLALNASIEAARAGEYGKGFAVVASEVSKLAERSQNEASAISKLSSESVMIAETAGKTITEMIPDIKKTAELVQEISASCGEQNMGAQQINQAILQLDQVVQQNASASEESASMSEELASQAEQLTATISFFKLDKIQRSTGGNTQRSVRPVPDAHPAPTHDTEKKEKGIHLALDDDSSPATTHDVKDSHFQEF